MNDRHKNRTMILVQYGISLDKEGLLLFCEIKVGS